VKKLTGIVIILLGFAGGAFFCAGGAQMYLYGSELTTLRSQSGTSVAEAYYQEIGHFDQAGALADVGSGFAVVAISLGLGGVLLSAKD
jgi:hypothetical protein